jgi:hypothetical protein
MTERITPQNEGTKPPRNFVRRAIKHVDKIVALTCYREKKMTREKFVFDGL